MGPSSQGPPDGADPLLLALPCPVALDPRAGLACPIPGCTAPSEAGLLWPRALWSKSGWEGPEGGRAPSLACQVLWAPARLLLA